MIKIFPVIVTFNKPIEESVTFLHLANSIIPNHNILVVDNSTIDYGMPVYCRSKGYNYHSMGGNKGLSKAYNKALEIIKPEASPNDLIIWLDDDTNIPQDYFGILSDQAAKNEKADIFVPIVKGQNGIIYSPNEGHFFGGKYMKNEQDEVCQAKFNGINTCLAVRLKIYDNYKYTERLFLDMVDNQFFDDMREKNVGFCVLRTVVYQNFYQRNEKLDANKLIVRFRIRVRDFMIYARHKGIRYLFGGWLKCIGWGLVNGYKSKSIKVFLFCCVKGTKELINNLY